MRIEDENIGDIGSDDGSVDTATHKAWVNEAHYQVSKALPMAIAGTIRSCTSIIELRALGHIGSKPLAGRSLSLLIVNLTGYPFMYGLGGALESLCSQAFTGARGTDKKIGVYVQHSIWLFLLANILVTILWLNPDPVFWLLTKTDPEVLHYARMYLVFECVYFPCIIVQSCLKRFLLAQGLMRPTVWFELIGLAVMYLSLAVLVDGPMFSLGFVGVPTATTLAYAAVLAANAIYIWISPCRKEWGRFTMADFRHNSYLITALGVPCGVSGIASYGFSDLATIAVTALGAEGLAIQAVLNSIKSSLSRTGSYLGMVISSRVGNLLGANSPERALLSAKVSTMMTLAATAIMSVLMLSFQRSIASFITDDESLISGLVPIMPMLVMVVMFDILSNVFTGVLRGQGRQGIAAVIRVIMLYVIAVPLAYVLCFSLELGLYVAESWLVFSSDWQGEADRCIERVNGSRKIPPPIDSPLDESTPLLRPEDVA
ncbi:ethionine resistance protein [Coemansia interrupta]|uniref:Ethionine resistance protein n=1 Tax=Coemansia interrupta TaxID=1126814 RepID=A0A9W8HAQ6_9FUNG|nr:ethionine resistance protein [Coemansia interrupta]